MHALAKKKAEALSESPEKPGVRPVAVGTTGRLWVSFRHFLSVLSPVGQGSSIGASLGRWSALYKKVKGTHVLVKKP
ncbi:hypothetical protein MPNT_20212 [Candidatus Methylacidithermus pantelleriae]|uniref:Uncharacterized protein n=1 Tax=Candidatus Methylacidithermus pantelleriae TaxID=2744239 RepID=A0A8J2BMN6_9BACT|nr:hypothetical protein MPNT_20212 [Candidatus Methylacidithermus pantelleriae]